MSQAGLSLNALEKEIYNMDKYLDIMFLVIKEF